LTKDFAFYYYWNRWRVFEVAVPYKKLFICCIENILYNFDFVLFNLGGKL